jgi:hypothetical protein
MYPNLQGKSYRRSEGGIGRVLRNGQRRRLVMKVATRRRGLRRRSREEIDEIGAEEEYR